MSDVTEWIAEAGRGLGREFQRASPNVATEVVRTALGKFVEREPRVWWLGLVRPFRAIDSSNRAFREVLPLPCERVWFIPEDGSESLPVYDLTPEEVDLVRSNCPLFEYNVVDKDYRWLVSESDHDQFLIVEASGS